MSDGILIPKIQSIQDSAPASVGRIQAQVQIPQGTVQAGSELVSNTLEFIKREEEFAADAKSDELADKYYKDLKTRYENMRQTVEGDPTPFYKKFNEENEAKLNEFLSQEDLPDLTKQFIKQKLGRVNNKFYDRVETWYAKASDDYKAITEKATLERNKIELQQDAANIVSGDETSFTPFEQTLSEIEDKLRIRGIEIGTITVDEKGNEIWSAAAKQRLARYRAEGIYGAIENLSISGQAEKAKIIFDKYEDYLDEYNKPKYEAKIRNGMLNNQADSMLNKWLSTNTPDKVNSLIELVEDQQLKSKLKDKFTTYLTRDASRKRQLSDLSFSKVQTLINQRMSSSQPYQNAKEMQDDPVIAALWDRLDPNDRKTAMSLVERPMVSNEEKRIAISEFYTNPKGFTGLSRLDFERMADGLNSVDYNRYSRLWESDNRQGSTGNTAKREMISYLKKRMDQAGMIRIKNNKTLNKSDTELLIQAENMLIDRIESLGEIKAFTNQSRDEVDNLINEIKTDRSKLTQPKVKKINSRPVNPSSQIPTSSTVISKPATAKAKRAFFSKNGYWPKTQEDHSAASALIEGK